jgi:uncharacterized protein YceK
MSRLTASLIALCLAACAGGCGTILNLKDSEPMAYGGLKKDAEWLECWTGPVAPIVHNPQTVGETKANWIVLGLSLLDVPLTATGDTITLPITLWLENRRAQERSRREAGVE